MIAKLAEQPRIDGLRPLGARFVYALRLIALHQQSGRDPVPELAVRLGSVETAAHGLALAKALSSCWPEPICVARFCCDFLTHDEHTIGGMIDLVAHRDRRGFDDLLDGLVRPDSIERLWTSAQLLVAHEMRTARSRG